jgi:hypothetical protein
MGDILKLMKNGIGNKNESLPDMDGRYPLWHSVVYIHYRLIEEYLMEGDCREFDKLSRQVM